MEIKARKNSSQVEHLQKEEQNIVPKFLSSLSYAMGLGARIIVRAP
jgi:hypothetical protein